MAACNSMPSCFKAKVKWSNGSSQVGATVAGTARQSAVAAILLAEVTLAGRAKGNADVAKRSRKNSYPTNLDAIFTFELLGFSYEKLATVRKHSAKDGYAPSGR